VTTGDYHQDMKSVGVKQLKARLSEYIRLVKTGETVLITDRDEVVAELRPAHRHGRAGPSIEDRLQALAEAGEVTRPSLPKGDWTWKAKGLRLPWTLRPGCSTRFAAIASNPARGRPLYLDTSALLRATLESGTSPESSG
jgi:antitoxin (DNA-binding transcriptional repressor) of toxin-antitoxin stability system